MYVYFLTVDLLVESKENQWMGVSVQSQGPGGKIVVCAIKPLDILREKRGQQNYKKRKETKP